VNSPNFYVIRRMDAVLVENTSIMFIVRVEVYHKQVKL